MDLTARAAATGACMHASMQHFASQLRPGQQTSRSLRAELSRHHPRTPRRDPSQEPPDSPQDELEHEAVPHPPLRNGAAPTTKLPFSGASTQQELAGLHPPLFALGAPDKRDPVGGPGDRPALRKTHLDVLSTVMHRCLLQGDYDRAARAWGMLLRTQVRGESIDPRNNARWGIGAELLLRPSHDHTDISTPLDGPDAGKRFERARDYYERLIVQYPHRRIYPDRVDSRYFYPPLFSIWICSVVERSIHARMALEIERERTGSASIASEGDTTVTSGDARARETAIHDDELAAARQICERLDQLVVSPPFDKNVPLLLLRANVGLWLSDLILGVKTTPPQDDDWDMEDEDDHMAGVERPQKDADVADSVRKLTDSLAELQRALQFFARAEANGSPSMVPAKSRIDLRIRDLTKRRAKLTE